MAEYKLNYKEMKSELFKLVGSDWIKGLITAVIGAVLITVQQALSNGGSIDWRLVGGVAISTGVSYLIKNFFSDDEGAVMGIEATK